MLLFTSLLLAFAPPAGAQDAPPADQILWERSLDDARALAVREGRPILAVVNADGESASERVVRERYRDPEFVGWTRAFVCVLASPFRHAPLDEDGRGLRIPDPRFGAITSGEALALEPVLHAGPFAGTRIELDGQIVDRISPRHALLLEDGTKAFDLYLLFDLRELDGALRSAAEPLGPRAPWEPPFDDPWSTVPGRRAEQWALAAAARSNLGRSFLEARLASERDLDLLRLAPQAIGAEGDAGSVAALAVLAARAGEPGAPAASDLVRAARGLGADAAFRDVLVRRVRAVDADPSTGDAGRGAPLLPALGELAGDDPLARSLVTSFAVARTHAGPAREGLARLLGAEASAAFEAAVDAGGGPLDVRAFLHFVRTARPPVGRLRIDDPLPSEAELEAGLAELEERTVSAPEDPDAARAFGRALLALARRRVESGGAGAGLLFEDALRTLEQADRLSGERDPVLALDLARATYQLGDARGQESWALAALERTGFSLERRAPLSRAVPADDTTVEALRWLGDAAARLLAERASGRDPKEQALGLVRGVRALALAAASAESDEADWQTLAAFFGAMGRTREQVLFAIEGLERHPASDRLRAELTRALALAGRPGVLARVYDRLAARHPTDAASAWYAGWAFVQRAEWERRGEEAERAIESYRRAEARFARSVELEPSFEASATHWRAMCALGRGFAHLLVDRQAAAAEALAQGIGRLPSVAGVRDGLGREAVDLLDGALEWRARGASPVDPVALLERLLEVDAGNPAWPRAVADAQLREAWRAAERGRAVLAGRGFDAALAAAESARSVGGTPEDDRLLAQAATSRAEAWLAAGEGPSERVRGLLERAAALLGVDSGGDPGELARRLRDVLGPARPAARPGR